MATFEFDIPDPYIAAHPVGAATSARAAHIQNTAAAVKILAGWGKTFAELTVIEKGELMLAHHVWTVTRRYEKRDAEVTAGDAVDLANLDDFNP